MLRNVAVASALACLLLVCVGCGSAEDPSRPPQIQYGSDTCDECHMIISEPRFAAAWRTRDGEVKRFDDVGDLVVHYKARKRPAGVVLWFHDYDAVRNEAWLQKKDAFLVKGPGLHTPMGHAVVAVASLERAKEVAREARGSVVTFDQLARGK